MRWIALVVLLLAGRAQAADTGRVVSASLFTAAELSLAADALQTLQISRFHGGPREYRFERNPILGTHPSDAAVLAYFGGLVAANAAVYVWAPRWVSNVVSGGVLAVEIPQIAVNSFRWGMAIRFP